uniref:Uncharacterized protein n=1 Tax=Alexandrium catenella TaxID=2925 RepID=A0A7S1SA79_ALECA
MRPASSVPAGRWSFATTVPEQREEQREEIDPVLQQELELFAAEEKAFAEMGRYTGSRQQRNTDAPKTIERLSDFMTLLGPRYKTVSKEMLFNRSEVGDLGAFRRRRLREKRDAAQRGLSERAKMFGGFSRSSSDINKSMDIWSRIDIPAILEDPDGSARAAWLNARAQEVTEVGGRAPGAQQQPRWGNGRP